MARLDELASKIAALLRRHAAALLVAVVALTAAAVAARATEWMAASGPYAEQQRARHRGYQGLRLLRDDYDRRVYADRGAFAIVPGLRPYREVPSEYPQLATYLFAAPYLVTRSREAHGPIFSVMMALALGGLAFVVAGLLRKLGRPPSRALLLLLPGTVYFSINRFDVLPALIAAAAMLALLSRRSALAHGLLAVAFLTKAYAVLYLPLFLALSHREGGLRRAARDAAVFAAIIVVASAQLALWVGFDAVLAPFRYQLGREENAESLYHFVAEALSPAARPALKLVFLALQTLPAVLAAWWGRAGGRDALRWMTAITFAFAVFARFQSPQWVVWMTPLAVVAAATAGELMLVIALDLLAYLYFPLAYDALGPQAPGFAVIIGVTAALRLTLVVSMILPRRA